MKTISFINLKGGVGKTISAINFAHILAHVHNKRVLLVDNDKQGNASKFFGVYDYDVKTISDIMTEPELNPKECIYKTEYERLDIMPANMLLLTAIQRVTNDKGNPQQVRLARALDRIQEIYDYCIIDNPPDVNISVINALIATQEVLVPVKADQFSIDGLETIIEQTESIKKMNKDINFKGCFLTMYQRNSINNQAIERLKGNSEYKVFDTVIRNSTKVAETTHTRKPIAIQSKKSNPSKDFTALVNEYLSK